MKTSTPIISVPFDQVINLFKTNTNNSFSLDLDSSVGSGNVQVFEISHEFHVRLWDCTFNHEIQMQSQGCTETKVDYFTLAFFLSTQGLQFYNDGNVLPENTVWDTFFVSSTADYTLNIAPFAKAQCVSITFSKNWLHNNVFENNEVYNNLKEKLNCAGPFFLLDSMSMAEKKMIRELLEASWEKSLGSFYIKSAVLKIICDFFYQLKEKQSFNSKAPSPSTSVLEVEKFLCQNLSFPLPNLKDLAYKFSVSESTLKRHFKKKHGVNMYTYFIKKKMEYAKYLMEEKNTSTSETAGLVGYRNVNNFVMMFKKHTEP